MKHQTKKAILLVSFGTSYEDTRKKNLDRLEDVVKEEFPEYRVYTAWSCERLIRKVQRQQNYLVNTVQEALEQMQENGIDECIVQPTFVTSGVELELVTALCADQANRFSSLIMGKPLLSNLQDAEQIVQIFIKTYQEVREDACLILMGHGTVRDTNSFYYILNEQFRISGYRDIMLGTIEEKDSVERMLENIRLSGKKKIILIPFLLTAGRHVEKDMLGNHPDSWKSQLESAGYEVAGVIKGLCEYEKILELYVSHIKEKMG